MTYMQVSLSRLDRRHQLFELADSQAGYFTAAQARSLGFVSQYQAHHRRSGTWQQVGRGIYRLRDYPQTDHEQLVQLTLWSHNRQQQPQAVVSHQTALAFFQLSDVMPARISLTAPLDFRKIAPAGVVLYRANLERIDYQDYGGFRVTTPLRTLLDVAQAHLSIEHLEVAVQQALERGLVRRGGLRAALKQAILPQAAGRILGSLL
jgi:predicted transcriptional regulator of viral defense system